MEENNNSPDMNSAMSTSTDKMQRSAYAAVVFLNVAEMYPEDAHVECSYTITADIKPASRDWIGLYRVGWMSPNDYFYYEWAPMPKDYKPDTESQSKILFQAHNLPNDDGEFYQVCYVASGGQIRGASTPFQFKRPCANDFVELEDVENDMLVVREKKSYLEENLKEVLMEKADILLENENLIGEKKELKKSLKEHHKQLKTEKNAVKELKEKLDEKTKELEENNSNTKVVIMAHDELLEKIKEIKEDKEQREVIIETLQCEITTIKDRMKTLQTEKDELDGQNQMLRQETEIVKNHLAKSEGKASNFACEIQKMQKDIGDAESSIAKYQMEIATLKANLHQQTLKSDQQIHVMSSTVDTVEKLKEKLQNTEDKLETAVKIKELMSNEMGAYSVANDDLKKELDMCSTENLELKKEVERMETGFCSETQLLLRENEGAHRDLENVVKEKEKLQKELSAIKDKGESGSTAAMYALQVANDALKDRHKLMEAELERKQAEVKSVQREASVIEKELRREIEDLKERITMCSDAYSQLYRQNIKIQKKSKSKKVVDGMEQSVIKNRLQTSGTCTTSIDPVEDAASAQCSTDSDSQISNEMQPAVNKDIKMKLMNYKSLYQEEKKKNETMHDHHNAQINKKDGEIDKFKSTITSRNNELEHKLMSCMSFLAEKDRHIEKLNHKLREVKKGSEVQASQPGNNFQLIYGNPYLRKTETCQHNYGPGNHLPPLIYPHIPTDAPFAWHRHTYSNNTDHLSDTDSTDGLPAPIIPTVLPSAKAAAVRATCFLNTDDQSDMAFVDAESDWDKTVPSAPVDLEEDKFVDAKGVGMRSCPGCNVSFSPDMSDFDFEKHVLTHSGRICPVCDHFADENTSDTDFEYHVNCCIDNESSK